MESNVDNDYGVLVRIVGVMKAVLLCAEESIKLLFRRNQHRPRNLNRRHHKQQDKQTLVR